MNVCKIAQVIVIAFSLYEIICSYRILLLFELQRGLAGGGSRRTNIDPKLFLR